MHIPISALSTERAAEGIAFSARTVAAEPPGPPLAGSWREAGRAGGWRVLERCGGGG